MLPARPRVVASYSHSRIQAEGEPPVVHVPGWPPQLLRHKIYGELRLPWEGPRKSEKEVRDDIVISSSMEVMLKSLKLCAPEFDLGSVDIVTDRYALHQLLNFCGSPDR